MLKFNFRQRTIPVCRTDSPKCYHPLLLLTTEYPATPQKAKRSFRAAGKSCFCNDEIFFGGDGYYIFAKRADYIYKEYDSYS